MVKMIKDIVDRFVLREQAMKAPVRRVKRDRDSISDGSMAKSIDQQANVTQERTEYRNRPLWNMMPFTSSCIGDSAEASQVVEIHREALIDVLRRSHVDTFSISVDLLKWMGWRGSTSLASKPDKSVPSHFESKLIDPSIVIEIVDSDRSDGDEEEHVPLSFRSSPTNIDLSTESERETSQFDGTRSFIATQATSVEASRVEDASMMRSSEVPQARTETATRQKNGVESPSQMKELSPPRNGRRKRLSTPSQSEATPLASNKKVRITSRSQPDLESESKSKGVDPSRNLMPSTIVRSQSSVEIQPDECVPLQQLSSTTPMSTPKKNNKNARLLKELSTHLNPGILSVCHKPRIFPSPSNFNQAKRNEFANFLTEALQGQMPEYSEEIPVKGFYPTAFMKDFPDCIVDPTRVERAYYKAHLSCDFADHFAPYMPDCVRIKSTVSKKAIAFISTVTATRCDTHYDQDTSFLLLLTGTKEVFYAPPSMVDRLRDNHPVLSHSSIFEEVNPFVAATGQLWEFVTLRAGDGLLLPQGWIHAIKSVPGTVAISFQVESSGIDATSPYVRRSRNANPEDLRHLSNIKVLTDDDDDDDDELVQIEEPTVRTNSHPLTTSMDPQLASTRLDVACEESGFSKHAQDQPKEVCGQVDKKSAKLLSRNPVSISSVKPVVKRGLPTKKQDASSKPSAPRSLLRRSRRERLECGVEGCKRTFPVDCGLMWVMVLSLEDNSPEDLPVVPTFHPKHLICVECRPQNGQAVVSADEVLNDDDRREIRDWHRYSFYAASKVDYEKWANHSGRNGQIHLKFYA